MLIPYLTLQRKHRKKKVPLGKLGVGCGLSVSIILLVLVSGFTLGYIDLVKDLPSIDSLPIILDPQNGNLLQPTRFYDRTGSTIIFSLQNPASADGRYLTLDTSQPNYFPANLIDATLAAVDPNYWTNNDNFLLTLIDPNSQSHLTREFINDIFLTKEPPGLRRYLRELILSAQVIQQFGKQQILEWYLNSKQYGPSIYGADAASYAYFDKPASKLNLAEAAFLAVMAETPQANPWDFPQNISSRQLEILEQMQIMGFISKEDEQVAKQAKIMLRPEARIFDLAPDFSMYVLNQLQTLFPGENFERGGWEIITTLDLDLQQQTQCTVQSLLIEKNPDKQEKDFQCKAERLLPSFSIEEIQHRESLNVDVLILDPQNGQILTMIGDVNRPHLAGTLSTPIVYLTAFSRGTNPGSLTWDIPTENNQSDSAGNYSSEYYGPVRIRTALANDYLQPVESLIKQLGENVIQVTANQLGIQMTFDSTISSNNLNFLDRSQFTLSDITQAFSIFSNEGVLAGQIPSTDLVDETAKVLAASIIQVADHNGTIWMDWSSPETRLVLTPQLAFLMNHVLSDETARWASLGHPNSLEIGRPAGTKIGTSKTGLDSWTIGYTPQLVTGVWIGNMDLNRTSIPVTLSAGLWHALMQYASLNKPIESWETPPGITYVDICDPSGLLPTTYCPTIVTEVFISGSEPTQADYLYQAFQINRETGRLATVFTPPELIEEKIFMIVPVEAAEWAKEAGLPLPPETYDAIYSPPSSASAYFSSPEMFAHVNGVVEFYGTAGGQNLDYFRLQIGKGLNPQVWTQIDEDSKQAISDGILGTWDSAGQSGLYAVQLLVIGKDQRIERAVMQITVDNDAPEIKILSPTNDLKVNRTDQSTLVLNAQVNDNLEIGRVEFFIDKELVTSLSSPPYYIAWPTKLGEHTLLVRAFDLAGNESETSVNFQVK